MLLQRAAIVGSGIIGRSWAIVYARAGVPVCLYDQSPQNRARALDLIGEALAQSAALIGDAGLQKAAVGPDHRGGQPGRCRGRRGFRP